MFHERITSGQRHGVARQTSAIEDFDENGRCARQSDQCIVDMFDCFFICFIFLTASRALLKWAYRRQNGQQGAQSLGSRTLRTAELKDVKDKIA